LNVGILLVEDDEAIAAFVATVKVSKIDFAISNKAHLGDTPGAGIVAIDEVEGFR
jgi:hypothetical protein